MPDRQLTTRDWIERIVLALLFIAIGAFTIIVFTPWGLPPTNRIADYAGRIAFSAGLAVVTWLVYISKRFSKYWQVFFGLLVLSIAVSTDYVFGQFVMRYLDANAAVPSGWAMPKLNELLIIGGAVIIFTKLAGGSMGSIYIQKGNLKLGLLIGGAAFLLWAVTGVPTAHLLFNGEGLTVAATLPWMPWLLLFVLANGAMEELLFRGLFLRKLEPFYGKFLSNVLVALVFTVLHKGAFYTSSEYLFLAILFPLALVCGWIMQKTDSIWGSILFHAGMDIPLMLGVFWNL